MQKERRTARKQRLEAGKANFANNNRADDTAKSFTFISFEGSNTGAQWDLIIDSGCTGYMIEDRKLFTKLEEKPMDTVDNANSSKSEIMGTNTVQCWVKDSNGKKRKMEFKDACYVSSYSHNLISVKYLLKKGADVVFNDKPHMEIRGTVFPFKNNNVNLFSLQVFGGPGTHEAMNAVTLLKCHDQLRHNNKDNVAKLPMMVEGMQSKERPETLYVPSATHKD